MIFKFEYFVQKSDINHDFRAIQDAVTKLILTSVHSSHCHLVNGTS